MSKAFYRKYRSRKLSEIVGQDHITKTLDNALKSGKISHAYLFTGPKGVGKTSIARILAHEINGLEYDEESSHIDIIEIDAASNRRIDEIRDIRDKVHIAPTSAKYKVYIIDEVHMLTKEAFNALLKTLEEPPQHAVFILATTEAHKLPDTIISRTQRYNFRPIDDQAAKAHLAEIAAKEGIKISDEALALIAGHGGGSFRDSIGLLDQLAASSKTLDVESVQAMLGVPQEEEVAGLYAHIESGSLKQVADDLEGFRTNGVSAVNVARELAKQIRRDFVNNHSRIKEPLELMELLLQTGTKLLPDDYLEIISLKMALNNLNFKLSEALTPKTTELNDTPKVEAGETKQHVNSTKSASISMVTENKPKPKTKATNVGELNDEMWLNILADIKKAYSTLYGIMRMSRPSLNEGVLRLEFGFPFHLKQMESAANRQKILTVIEKHLGSNLQLVTILNKEVTKQEPVAEAPPSDTALGSITNIFGGGEVLES